MRRTNFKCEVPNCDRDAKICQMCPAHFRRFKRHGDPFGGRLSKGARLKWLTANADHAREGCLIPDFLGSPNYWQFRKEGKNIGAHRWMCEQRHGPAPTKRHQAAHCCGNGHLGCVNPKHLRWALPIENNADKLEHGTQPLGEGTGSAKLSAEEVAKIRDMADAYRAKDIAAMFGVSRSNINSILARKTWRHVD